MPLIRPLACPERRPERFSAGSRLAGGTCHVVSAGVVFTICRIVDDRCWYPLTQRDNPAWQTWPTRDAAEARLDGNLQNLRDYPFWGC